MVGPSERIARLAAYILTHNQHAAEMIGFAISLPPINNPNPSPADQADTSDNQKD
jgi:hypothetical protein